MMVFKNSFISQNFDNGVISSEIIRYINEFNSYFEKNENFKLDSKININKIINNMRSIIKTNRNKYFNNKLRIDYIINNFMQNKDRYNFEIVDVKSETVDNYTKKNNLNFDFIKIDIEGEELKALQGMRNLLSNNVPKVVVVEYHSKEIKNFIISFIKEYKYSTKIINNLILILSDEL